LIERYFSLSQPLEWPATRAARQQAAEAGVRSAYAGFEETQINVKARVKRRFFELLLAETLADLASRLLNTVTELERAVKRRVESGEAPPFELVKVNVESLQTQKQVSQTKGKVRTNQVALNQLTDGNLGKAFAIQGDFESVKGNLNEQRLIEDAFQHHPEVRKFKQLIEVAGAHYNQEQHARIPNVTISGAFQRDAGRKGFLGGLSVPLPLWNQRQGGIAKALGLRRQAEANLRQAQISLRKGITEHVQISKTASTQISTFEQGLLKQAKEAVRIARTSFTFGEASLLDVLDAQRMLWQTFQGYAYARFDLAIALTELERLVGKEL
jgi:cobalt-zinc-cadmium efflux system outer membrane protein